MDKGKKKGEQTKAAVSNEDHKTKYVKNNNTHTHTHTRTFFKLVFPTRLNSWLANGRSKAKHACVQPGNS